MHQIENSGMSLMHFQQVKKIQLYPDVKSIVQSLRGAGVHNLQTNRAPGLTGKSQWQTFIHGYEAYRTANKVLPVTYEVYDVIAQKI